MSEKSGSHGTVISANTTGCTSDTPSRSLIDVTIDSSRISFLSFLCSFVAVSFLISISASILFDTIVLAAWLSSIVTIQRYTDKLAANDNNTTVVRFLSFTSCSKQSLFITFDFPARFVFFNFEADRYPSASIGETAVAILTGFLFAEKIVNPTSKMVASKTVGWKQTILEST